jgi:ABC-type polysaccharide/polyol phosphate transport system ATPase subunit
METNDILSAPVIQVEDLGKRFRIGERSRKESFLATTRRLLTGGSSQRELWALRNDSFKVERGEALGVIGPNGAGKSTLLLLLSQILNPTEGRCRVSGKAHCFFRIGTALQPRLTVLENFSLCSALLGLDRNEFRARLPAMISFSGLGDYLYAKYGELSTGLAARLPFSAAVHTDLEIILVDEMLMVGDRAFQAKCLKTFHDFRAQGKTLVIVSHSLPLIESLCQRALYLNAGKPVFLGESGEAIRRFMDDAGNSGEAQQQSPGADALRQGFGARLHVPKIVSAVSRRMAFELGSVPAEGGEDWGEGIKDAKTRELIDAEVRRLAPELRRAARKSAAIPQPPPAPREPLRDQIRKDVEQELGKMRQEMRSCLEEYGEKTSKVLESVPAVPPQPSGPQADIYAPERAIPLWREMLGHEGPLDICSSRQAALGTLLRALSDPEAGNGAVPGDEIILAPLTWPWVMRGVSDCGFTPVLADISPESSNLDAGSVLKALSPRTRAVLVSHNGNSCADLDSLSALCAEKGLRLIDCSSLSSMSGLYDRRFIGAKSDMGLLFPMSPQSRWGLIFSNIPKAQGAFSRLLSERTAPEGANLFLPDRAAGEPLAVAARVASRMKEKERRLRDTEAFAAYTGFFKAYGDFLIIPKPPQKARLAGRFFIVIVRPGAPFGAKDLPGPTLLGEARRTALGGYGRYSPMPGIAFRQEGDLPRVRELVERGVMYAVLQDSQDREAFFETFSGWMTKWKRNT